MTVWDHSFRWALDRGIPDAFAYAEFYASRYPEGDYSHPVVYVEFLSTVTE